jgi:cob(I)alamin adenosyltransferase
MRKVDQTSYNLHMSDKKSTGDDGYTDLLGDERVAKYDLRPSTYGIVDEASAALGLARSFAKSEDTKALIQEVQKDLYHMMAELAATKQAASRFRKINPDRIAWLEEGIKRFEEEIDIQRDFVLVGDSQAAAALDLARTIVRRAERDVARLVHQEEIDNAHLLVYLNRLSNLCFTLMLWEDHLDGNDSPQKTKELKP